MSALAPERFVPQFGRVAQRWAWIWSASMGVVAGIVAVEEGGWPDRGALAFTLGIVLLVYALLLGIMWWRRTEAVEVRGEGVRITDRRGAHAVQWNEIERYRHYNGKTERWLFDRRRGGRLNIYPEGLAAEENRQLRERLYAGLVTHGLAEAQPNGRYRPLT